MAASDSRVIISGTVNQMASGLLKQVRAALVDLLQAECQEEDLEGAADIAGISNAKVRVGSRIVMQSDHGIRSFV